MDVVSIAGIRKGHYMKIIVVGGTGLVGSMLVPKLTALGHQAIAASPQTGINTVTGEGFAQVLEGAHLIVDVSNSPSFEDQAVLDFFTTSTNNILHYGAKAGVAHVIALSVVGTQKLGQSSYFRAKIAQEELISKGPLPYSIVHATQFFEFMKPLADLSTTAGKVHLPPAFIQPMAADDVASAIARISLRSPANGIVEVAGPNRVRLDSLIQHTLDAIGDSREVIADVNSLYFGAHVDEDTLVPGLDAELSTFSFDDWLDRGSLRKV
jgi:uncharacterized protein YbjT (DUF2867 family)